MDEIFLTNFKIDTEAKWSSGEIDPTIYGFQFQAGTKWNPGLTSDEIDQYEQAIGAQFPDDFRLMLQHLNGTDRPNLNVYGSSVEQPATMYVLYAFPRDLGIIKSLIEDIQPDLAEIAAVLAECEGFKLHSSATLVPIFGHRYLVCESDRTQSRVLSIFGTDAITYGLCLKDYLSKELLG